MPRITVVEVGIIRKCVDVGVSKMNFFFPPRLNFQTRVEEMICTKS